MNFMEHGRRIFKCLTILFIIACSVLKMESVGAHYKNSYDEELFMPVGSYFSMDTRSDVHYSIDGNNARVVMTERGKEVYLFKLGKVIVQANYYLNGNHKMPYKQRYLINIVPLTVYQDAQKDNFARLKHNSHVVYSEVDKNFAQNVLIYVNRERAKVGAPPLRLDADLQQGAAIRAREITQLMSHTRPNGKECKTVLRNQVYVGENIAAGNPSAEGVVKQWMDSLGHRKNILNPMFCELGVGFFLKEDDHQGYRYYWVQMFRGYPQGR